MKREEGELEKLGRAQGMKSACRCQSLQRQIWDAGDPA